jgi:chromosome segregation ATPase
MTRLDEIKQAFEQRGYLCNDESEFLLTSLTEMETQLHLEQKSVNELSLALQDAEERVKELEGRIAVLELPSRAYNNTLIRAEQAESKLKKFCEAVERHRDIIGESASEADKALYKVLEEIK